MHGTNSTPSHCSVYLLVRVSVTSHNIAAADPGRGSGPATSMPVVLREGVCVCVGVVVVINLSITRDPMLTRRALCPQQPHHLVTWETIL